MSKIPKLVKGDYVKVYCGKLSSTEGIYIRSDSGAYIGRTVVLVNVKQNFSLAGKKELDTFEWYRAENVSKMTEEQASKYNWKIKEEE